MPFFSNTIMAECIKTTPVKKKKKILLTLFNFRFSSVLRFLPMKVFTMLFVLPRHQLLWFQLFLKQRKLNRLVVFACLPLCDTFFFSIHRMVVLYRQSLLLKLNLLMWNTFPWKRLKKSAWSTVHFNQRKKVQRTNYNDSNQFCLVPADDEVLNLFIGGKPVKIERKKLLEASYVLAGDDEDDQSMAQLIVQVLNNVGWIFFFEKISDMDCVSVRLIRNWNWQKTLFWLEE